MSIVLPIVRLLRDGSRGFVDEPATVKEFRIMQTEFCSQVLAQAWIDGRLCYMPMRMPELDDEPIRLTALCVRAHRQDLFEAGEIMCEGRKLQRMEQQYSHGEPLPQDIEYGYDIAPAGLTETFGAHCGSTAAWLSIHKVGPALLFRQGDDLDSEIEKWLTYWAESLSLPMQWPVLEDHNVLVVPETMQEFVRKSRLSARFRKISDGRRFALQRH